MPGGAELEQALSRALARALGTSQLNHLVRFEPVLGLLRERAAGHVLDVGSGSAGLAQLLGGEWRITALDVAFTGEGRMAPNEARICGDVRRLPIPADAFDVVLAVDLLEHLHPDDRIGAVQELGRVARHQVIIACPTGRASLEGDRRLAARLEARGRQCPEWLAEHLERGFPEEDQLTAAMETFGLVRTWGNESIQGHERLIRIELSRLTVVPARLLAAALAWALRSHRRRPRLLAAGVLRRLRGMDRPPHYRTIVSVTSGDGALPGSLVGNGPAQP